MACKGCSCSTSKEADSVAGCGSTGCSTGGCNRMNTFDWLTALDIDDFGGFDTVEVTFKNGSRKEFFKNPSSSRSTTGDMVLVEADNNGYDVGRISLSGELVRMQMKKRNVKENAILGGVIRKANERDLERLQESREAEKPTMIHARAIARSLNLDMKIGDVEYQGDKRKATFFYTADGRVDFRELIREFAKEFKVKIEMRQIGARQESARVGGLGPCGRELCCSTWLTDFKSVSTTAARYQNLAINQSKLSGQCGRLKCCLNYELDTYMDALEQFPTKADKIFTEEGGAYLMKTDIFKGIMYYCYEKDHGRGKFYPLEIEQVKEVLALNKAGQKPPDLLSLQLVEEEEEEVGFDGDLTGVVELPNDRKKKKKKKKKPEAARKDERAAPKTPNANSDNRGEAKTEGAGARKENPRRDDRRPNKERNSETRPPRDNSKNPNTPQAGEPRPIQEARPPREPRPNNPNKERNNEVRPPRDNSKNPNAPQAGEPRPIQEARPPREPRPNNPNKERNNENRPPRPPRPEQPNAPQAGDALPNQEARPPREPRPNNPNKERNNENRPPRPPRPEQPNNTAVTNNTAPIAPPPTSNVENAGQTPSEKSESKNSKWKNKWKNKNKGDKKPPESNNNDKKD
jgi:cell fate regulator YaaT (PSP1 superfamily)